MNVEEMLHSVEGGQDAPGARVVLPEAVKAFIRHLDLRACGKDWPVSEVRREVKKWSDRKDNEYGMTRRVGGFFLGSPQELKLNIISSFPGHSGWKTPLDVN